MSEKQAVVSVGGAPIAFGTKEQAIKLITLLSEMETCNETYVNGSYIAHEEDRQLSMAMQVVIPEHVMEEKKAAKQTEAV